MVGELCASLTVLVIHVHFAHHPVSLSYPNYGGSPSWSLLGPMPPLLSLPYLHTLPHSQICAIYLCSGLDRNAPKEWYTKVILQSL